MYRFKFWYPFQADKWQTCGAEISRLSYLAKFGIEILIAAILLLYVDW